MSCPEPMSLAMRFRSSARKRRVAVSARLRARLFVDPERLAHLAPSGELVGIGEIPACEELKMLPLAVRLAVRFEPGHRHRHQALRPRAKKRRVGPGPPRRRDTVPTIVERVGPDIGLDRSGVPPPFVDDEVANRLFQIGAEVAFPAIGVQEHSTGEHGRLEETLGEIVRLLGLPGDGGDECAHSRVVAVRELAERIGGLAARRRRQKAPPRRRERQVSVNRAKWIRQSQPPARKRVSPRAHIVDRSRLLLRTWSRTPRRREKRVETWPNRWRAA